MVREAMDRRDREALDQFRTQSSLLLSHRISDRIPNKRGNDRVGRGQRGCKRVPQSPTWRVEATPAPPRSPPIAHDCAPWRSRRAGSSTATSDRRPDFPVRGISRCRSALDGRALWHRRPRRRRRSRNYSSSTAGAHAMWPFLSNEPTRPPFRRRRRRAGRCWRCSPRLPPLYCAHRT